MGRPVTPQRAADVTIKLSDMPGRRARHGGAQRLVTGVGSSTPEEVLWSDR